ncbi:MAG: ribosome-associated translation inhibitor RaiA [Verrucomicrobia bacterium]|nr:ribosome-associated translation inhibitor RaiA [Verrucomicrobiota bacterium]
MKLILNTHKITLTEGIQNHVRNRIEKLEHLDHFAIEARVNLEHDHTGLPEKKFKCSIRLVLRGPDLFAEDYENDLYAAIDLVTKKIEQQIRKKHSKFKTRHQNDPARSKEYLRDNV